MKPFCFDDCRSDTGVILVAFDKACRTFWRSDPAGFILRASELRILRHYDIQFRWLSDQCFSLVVTDDRSFARDAVYQD